ncbi:hypothetical protein FRC03_006741 [Tulasnella sp. 419]|nr:hypothetical protein FRC03_006741 [Tulasnella sp. 419]
MVDSLSNSGHEQGLKDALRKCQLTCQTAHDTASLPVVLEFLSSNPSATVPIAVIRGDFLSLLSLLYSHATNLALSFKPPPTTAASIKCLNDIGNDVARFSNCATTVTASEHGSTLKKEFSWAVQEIIESIKALAEASPDDSSVEDRKLYLRRAGEVHAAIDKVRRNLPQDNYEAVQKRWKENSEALDDALGECKEMLEEEGDGNDDDLDDGWNDVLGTDSNAQKMSAEERERASKVHSLLRLMILLHKRFLSHHLVKLKQRIPTTEGYQIFDKMILLSSELAANMDDLVASLYSPQDIISLQSKTKPIMDIIHKFRIQVIRPVDSSDNSNASHQTAEQRENTTDAEKDRKWFETCFQQIERASQELKL